MKTKNLLLTLAVTMVFASCNKELEPAYKNGDIAAQFTTQISRAVGNSWSANDQIGIFMVEAGNDLSPTHIANNADNIAYITTSTGVNGIFAPVNLSQTIYFPERGNVDFISYYPHKPSLTKYLYPIDVSDQRNQEAIDLLYSNNAVGKNSTAPSVAFNFKHKLSKLIVKPSSNGEYTQAELAAMVVKIKGLNTIADFSLSANSISGQKMPAEITPKTVSAGVSYEAIVLPTDILTGASIEFVIAGKSLVWEIKTAAFIEGNRYNYNLVLGSNSVSVGDSTIDDWIDNTDPVSDAKLIHYTNVDNMEIEYLYNATDKKRIDEIKILQRDPTTGNIVQGGFSDKINITYSQSTITMEGTIPNPEAIDIYGKGEYPITFNAVYTLNGSGLASSATIKTITENRTNKYTTLYQYNTDKQLISAITTDSLGVKKSDCTATWADGNLTNGSIGSKPDFEQGGSDPTLGGDIPSDIWETYTEAYTYHSTINQGGALYPRTLPAIYYAQGVVGVFASAVGLLGKGPKNLLAKIVDSDDYQIDFTYTFQPQSQYLRDVTITDPTDPDRNEKVSFIFASTTK